MEEEIWKFYKDNRRYRKDGTIYCGGLYEVSNFGNVKKNGVLYNCPTRGGYKMIPHNSLHRVVAELFIPNPENKPCIDHIDGDKQNNNVNNLHWVTTKENNNNPITKERQSIARKKYLEEHPDAMKGENNPMFGENIKDHMSEEAYNEWRRKQSESRKGIPLSEEAKQKSRKTWKEKYENGYVSPMIGHVFSEDRNKKISESKKGENNPMYGIPPKNKGKRFNKNTRHYE